MCGRSITSRVTIVTLDLLVGRAEGGTKRKIRTGRADARSVGVWMRGRPVVWCDGDRRGYGSPGEWPEVAVEPESDARKRRPTQEHGCEGLTVKIEDGHVFVRA